MTQKQRRLFYLTSVVTVISLSYLFWWDVNGVHTGIYDRTILVDKLAMVGFFLLIPSAVTAIIGLRTSRYYAVCLAGILLFVLQFFDVFESGRQVARLQAVEHSVFYDLVLKDNGSFKMTETDQNISKEYFGVYVVDSEGIRLFRTESVAKGIQKPSTSITATENRVKVEAEDFNLYPIFFEVVTIDR